MAKRLTSKEYAERTGEIPRAVRYLRVSRMGDRTLDSEEFHSAELQLAAIDRELERQFPDGWEPVPVMGNYDGAGPGVWADFDVSGRTWSRAGLEAALDAVTEHKAEALGVLNLSRWARHVLNALKRMEELEKRGAALYSAQERTDMKTPAGKFATFMFLAVAQLLSDQKSEEWSEVIAKRSNAGWHHGQPPIGYTRRTVEDEDEDEVTGDERRRTSGPLVIDESAAEAVVAAFEAFAAGASKQAAGKILWEAGVSASKNHASRVLANRVYVRRHTLDCAGTACARTDTHGDRGEVRQWELSPDDDRKRVGEYWTPGLHEGIVDADLFDRVQSRLAKLADNAGTQQRQRTARHEMTGIVRCASCGRALSMDYSRTQPTMKCSSGQAEGCRGPGVVRADKVLSLVWDALVRLDAGADRAAERAARQQGRARAHRTVDTAKLARQQAGLLERVVQVEMQSAMGEYPGGDAEARAVIEGLRVKAADLGDKIAKAAVLNTDDGDQRRDVKALVGDWEDLSVEARNAALRRLCEVYVGRRSPDAPWQQPYEERCVLRWSWLG